MERNNQVGGLSHVGHTLQSNRSSQTQRLALLVYILYVRDRTNQVEDGPSHVGQTLQSKGRTRARDGACADFITMNTHIICKKTKPT